MHGTLIVIEGPDGSGTSSHSALLAERLQRDGHDVLHTAEPTKGAIGSFVREELSRGVRLPASAMQLLFCADRADHVETVIAPSLAQGKTVVMDRYYPSTIVYGTALGVDPAWLERVNAAFPKPDVLLFMLPPFDVCLERVMRRQTHDAYENEEFMRKVHGTYTDYAAMHPDVRVIDSSGDKEAVAEEIYRLVVSG